MKFQELRVLQAAEAAGDGIWRQVVRWAIGTGGGLCRGGQPQPKTVHEADTEYVADPLAHSPVPLLTEEELEWILASPNT